MARSGSISSATVWARAAKSGRGLIGWSGVRRLLERMGMERGMADSVFVEASELGRRAQSDEAVEVLAPEAGPLEGGGEGGEGGSSARG